MINHKIRKIRIGVLDDHQIVIDGLKLLLNDQQELEVVAESNNGLEFLKELKINPVDIVLTDIIMPNLMSGIDFSKIVKSRLPDIKVLILSMTEEGKVIYELMHHANVDGFISKAAGKEELIQAIHTVCSSKKYFARNIQNIYDKYSGVIAKTEKQYDLSKRELEVVQCIAKHYSNKRIAEELFISERTVETHRKNIYRKTKTKGEAALIEFAKESKLL